MSSYTQGVRIPSRAPSRYPCLAMRYPSHSPIMYSTLRLQVTCRRPNLRAYQAPERPPLKRNGNHWPCCVFATRAGRLRSSASRHCFVAAILRGSGSFCKNAVPTTAVILSRSSCFPVCERSHSKPNLEWCFVNFFCEWEELGR
jgi:hypothetical protein